jgi:cephalosporin hydroxylase
VLEVFKAHEGRQIDRWAHYFDIYQRHFAKYVGTKVSVLEIGVDHGGSLQMWKEYFGHQALIVGVDIDARCKAYEEPQIQVEIGDQSDPGFWESLWDHYTEFDIVIDDGSHIPKHQEASFKALWPSTRGVYLIEDCHSGYPTIAEPDALRYVSSWVLVLERPKRVIRGTPSRELREDEREAQRLYSDA